MTDATPTVNAHLFSKLYRGTPLLKRCRAADCTTVEGRARQWADERFTQRDRGSKFDQQARFMAALPSVARNALLLRTGRDGILLELAQEQKMVGSCFLQVHPDNTIHSFHYFVLPEYQGRGYGRYLGHHFLEFARARLDFSDREGRPPMARLYAGGSDIAKRLYDGLKRREEELGVHCTDRQTSRGAETGWIRFLTAERRVNLTPV